MTIASQAHRRVTVIIATLASRERASALFRAISSILISADAEILEIVVCVNGSKWDAETVDRLRATAGIRLFQLHEPSLPEALLHGRKVVETEFFCFLDDDDEFLAKSIEVRLKLMDSNRELDLVVTNGINKRSGQDSLRYANLSAFSADPFSSLFVSNWLASCGALFRSSSVGMGYFENYHKYLEWTWLAFQLMMDGKRVAFIDLPFYVVNDTSGSLSKSTEYDAAHESLHKRMLHQKPPSRIRRLIRMRISASAHTASEAALRRGDIWIAILMHLKSMLLPGGVRYLLYSRYLVIQILGKLRLPF